MNIRFYNAKILTLTALETFQVVEGELWVKANTICYIGNGSDMAETMKKEEISAWEREIDVKGNLLLPGFKNAHAHTYMTFLRSYADDLPLQEWLYQMCFPKEEQADHGKYPPVGKFLVLWMCSDQRHYDQF